jgi:predicted Ser/Thr protein kinase
MVLLDLPKLGTRIAEIGLKYNEKNEKITEDEDMLLGIKTLIRSLLIQNISKSTDYWLTGGIRTMATDEFNRCMSELSSETKILGEGEYGKVYNIPRKRCFLKNLPANTKRVGIKIEKLKYDYDRGQTPLRLKEVIEIAKKANEIEIGPAIYDVFVTIASNGMVQIIKTFEIIDGESWLNKEWDSDEQKKTALLELDALIHTMNKAGIIHHDLHPGNVMIRRDGRIFIIDYDKAKLVIDEEKSSLASFNRSYPNEWSPTGVFSDSGIIFIYKALLEEGSILNGAKGGRFTRKKKICS